MLKKFNPLKLAQDRLNSLVPDMRQHLYYVGEAFEKGEHDINYLFMESYRQHLACSEFSLVNVYAFWCGLPAQIKTIFSFLSCANDSNNFEFCKHQHQILLETLHFLDYISNSTQLSLNEIELSLLNKNNDAIRSKVRIKYKHSFNGLLYRDWYEINSF